MTALQFSDKEMSQLELIAAQRNTSVEQVVNDCVIDGLIASGRSEKTKKTALTLVINKDF
jgi:hypothetical protein